MPNQPFKVIQKSQKQMPCNIEAEQALIGSILVSNDIYDEISSIIDSQKFFDPIHIRIYETIEKLISRGLLANPITLKNYFENNEGLKELGGQEYLIKITKNIPQKAGMGGGSMNAANILKYFIKKKLSN